jgi:hypothetical protein
MGMALIDRQSRGREQCVFVLHNPSAGAPVAKHIHVTYGLLEPQLVEVVERGKLLLVFIGPRQTRPLPGQ